METTQVTKWQMSGGSSDECDVWGGALEYEHVGISAPVGWSPHPSVAGCWKPFAVEAAQGGPDDDPDDAPVFVWWRRLLIKDSGEDTDNATS